MTFFCCCKDCLHHTGHNRCEMEEVILDGMGRCRMRTIDAWQEMSEAGVAPGEEEQHEQHEDTH